MIKDYNFEAYDPKFIAHLARHFEQNCLGSIFANFFRTPEEAIAFSLTKIKDYQGRRIVVEIDMPEQIGLEGIISLEELPEGTKIETELRDGYHKVNVVSGTRKPTKHLVIVAGPDPENSEKHGFISIYPGRYCPEIRDEEFWRRYAFIKPTAP